MSKKTSKEDIMKLAAERNQELLNSDKFDEIYQNVDTKMDFLCKTCGKTFSTTIRSYKNAKKTGCPECKTQKL
jgi:DNA-directed RNA polymerase subunit RPC12/RpoP